MKHLSTLLLLFSFSCNLIYGQTTLIMNGTEYPEISPVDCNTLGAPDNVNFFDMSGGGPSTPYLSSDRDTLTICPDLAVGSKITAAFATSAGFTWDVHSTDTLYIFDGASVFDPLMGKYNSNSHPNGFNQTASWNNPSGCLTFMFITSFADTADGWEANISCRNPQQPFMAHLEGYKNFDYADTLYPPDSGIIDICLGDSILFVAKPEFPYALEVTGTGYSQTTANSIIEWEFSDGTSQTGDSVWFTPPNQQGYLATLKITDAFPSSEYLVGLVRVSTEPSFSGIFAETDSICIGDTTFMFGGVTPADTVGVSGTSSAFAVGGSFAGITYLPDGNGVSYSTSIDIAGFIPGDTVSQSSDIWQMCATMEHTYLGDLEMYLECPNGSIINIFDGYNGIGGYGGNGFGGGGTFLGDADDASGIGIGWEYCFSTDSADWGDFPTEYANNNTLPTTISNGNAMNPNGIYLPEQSFADLIGCPVNGTWTIYIQDNIGQDDGYIFEWGLYFNPDLNPYSGSYQPLMVADTWLTDPTIISGQNDTGITIYGASQGIHPYTYQVLDNFGCIYDTTINLTVAPTPILVLTASDDSIQCIGDSIVLSLTGSSAVAPYTYDWNTGYSHQNDEYIVYPQGGAILIVTLTDFCGTPISDTIELFSPYEPLQLTMMDDTITCPSDGIMVSSFPSDGAVPLIYEWNTNETTNTINVTPASTTTYTVTVTDQCGETIMGTSTIEVPTLNTMNIVPEVNGNMLCSGDSKQLIANIINGAGFGLTYTWSNDPSASDSIILITINADTIVSVSVTDGCGFTANHTFSIAVPTYDDVQLFPLPDYLICEGDTVEAIGSVTGGTGIYTFKWEGSGLISNINEITTYLTPTDTSGYSLIATDECGLADTINVEILFDDCSVRPPKIFTPNGDAHNQYLHFLNLEKWPYNKLIIYDRWGRKLYDGNYNNNWSGAGQSDGVYFYVLTLAEAQDPITGFFHIAR